MIEYTLKEREDDTIKFNIGEKSFQIPLAMGLTVDEAGMMESTETAIEFFKKYIDEETASTLTLRQYRDMLMIWQQASRKSAAIGDASLGEL